MQQSLAAVAVVVRDYDEALEYYRGVLGFELVSDESLGGGKRWVLVTPPGPGSTRLLLARAANAEQEAVVGRQAGGRVWLFLHTDDFERDYRRYRDRGVVFVEEPRTERYGTVAVFEDLYGNRWDLIEPRAPSVS
jgi:catechol 2,3-dioxygenase-like lactoylglutathione lyase family enzyme